MFLEHCRLLSRNRNDLGRWRDFGLREGNWNFIEGKVIFLCNKKTNNLIHKSTLSINKNMLRTHTYIRLFSFNILLCIFLWYSQSEQCQLWPPSSYWHKMIYKKRFLYITDHYNIRQPNSTDLHILRQLQKQVYIILSPPW